MLPATISTSTVELSGFCSSTTTVPLKSLKRPRTVVNIMCLTASSTLECAGSMVQVVVVSAIGCSPLIVATLLLVTNIRQSNSYPDLIPSLHVLFQSTALLSMGTELLSPPTELLSISTELLSKSTGMRLKSRHTPFTGTALVQKPD